MPHLRPRFLAPKIEKLAKLWPVVGLLGPRQSGKTTLMKQVAGEVSPVSFDDLEVRLEARKSPKAFLARIHSPAFLDEVQKAPELFDAIKVRVDASRKPGQFYLTGSTGFSSKIGIRESLTGRIGLLEMHPMALAELHSERALNLKGLGSLDARKKPRFSSELIASKLDLGGMPVPAFMREAEHRKSYWSSWLETTLHRDLAVFFRRNYDPDFAWSLVSRMGAVMSEGELPTLKHFSQPAAKVRNYLSAMQELFLVRKISCHPQGIGKEAWIFFDAGLAAHVMNRAHGLGAVLSLARHFLWNEWAVLKSLQGERIERTYYKSARGSPVDACLDGVLLRVVGSVSDVKSRLSWEERPLVGAMRATGAKFGYLVAPIDEFHPPPKKGGIGILPWGTWS